MRQSINCIALACVLTISAHPVSAKDPREIAPVTAIQVVLDTQQEKLRAVDSPDNWWHDTKERSWSVKRQVQPGVLNTTHIFTVIYKIDGVAAAKWQVDTRAGTAVALP